MKLNQEIEKQTSRIADAIVELVEGTDGLVLLTQIDRDISGFAKETPPSWSKTINHEDRELLLWDGMTEAGAAALGHVIFGGRVAIQAVDARLYLLAKGAGELVAHSVAPTERSKPAGTTC